MAKRKKRTTKIKQTDFLPKLRQTQLKLLDIFVDFCNQHGLIYYLSSGTLLGAVRHKGYIPWDDDIDIDMPRADYEKFIRTWKDQGDIKLDCYKTSTEFWRPLAKLRDESTIYAEDIQTENYRGMRGIWIDIFPLDNVSEYNLPKLERRKHKMLFYGELIIRKSSINITWTGGIKHTIKNILAAILPRSLLCWLQTRAITSCKDDNSKYITTYMSKYNLKRQTHLRAKYHPIIQLEFEGRMLNAPSDYGYALSIIYGSDYMQLPPVDQRVAHSPIYAKFSDGTIIDFRKQGND